MSQQSKPRSDAPAKILEAADILFCERGYDAVSMQQVAEHAGVNKALLFYYFNSKDQLFDHVLEQYYASHMGALAASFAGGGDVLQRLHRMIDAYLDFMADNRRYAQLVQQQVAGGSVHRDLIRRNLKPLFDWTVEALSEIAPSTGPLAARHFYVTISGVVLNYFTYAPVLSELWGEDPLSTEAREERRQHVHWLVDALVDKLVSAR